MQKVKLLRIIIVILVALTLISIFGLSYISDIYVLFAIYCAITAAVLGIISTNLQKGLPVKYMHLGAVMMMFGCGFVATGDGDPMSYLVMSKAYFLAGVAVWCYGLYKKLTKNRQPKPKKHNHADVPKRNVIRCDRCKTAVSKNVVWMGRHKFCPDCAKITTKSYTKIPLTPATPEEPPVRRLCSVCVCEISDINFIYSGGKYYCKNCYKSAHTPKISSAPGKKQEIMQVGYALNGVYNQSPLQKVIEVGDRLTVGGFRFCKGIVEDAADSDKTVSYSYYEAFKESAEQDFQTNCGEQSKSNPFERVHIRAFFARNSLKVCIIAKSNSIVFHWLDATDANFQKTRIFTNAIAEEIYEDNCKIKNVGPISLTDEFLSNWS